MKYFFLPGFLLLLLLASCTKEEPPQDDPALMDLVSLAQFEEAIEEGVSLIFFHATWCSVCKNQRPAVEALLLDNDLSTVLFGEVNYEQVSEVVEKYGVQGFPTMLFFKDGEEKDRMVGAGHSSSKLKDRLMELMD